LKRGAESGKIHRLHVDIRKLVGDNKMNIVNKVVEITKEATNLARLTHPYILQYVDSFLDGDFYCIVTEYCEVSVILRVVEKLFLILFTNRKRL